MDHRDAALMQCEGQEDLFTSSCVTFSLHNETESLGGLLRYMLNSRNDVELAGSTQAHPSLSELRFKLQVTPDKAAFDVFLDALDETREFLQAFSEKVDSAFESFAN